MPFRSRSSPSWTGRRGPVVRNGGVRRAAAVTAARNRPAAIAAANVRTAGFIGMENKFVDTTVTDKAFTTIWAGGEMEDGTMLGLGIPAQGTGESERDGRVYTLKSLHIKGFIEVNSAESSTTPLADLLARLALVWDTQTNGAQMSAEECMLTIGTPDDVNSFRNLQFSHRFIVLKDKTFRIPVAQTSTNEGAINLFASPRVVIPFKMNKTFKKGIKIRCKGTGGIIGDVTDNSFHLIGTATSTLALLSYEVRARFSG